MKYQGLEWILCDEISMVSNEVWKYVNLCLQDILQNKLPFRGVNIIAIGDLFQLQPVKSNFIIMDLKHNYGPLATNLWCEYFTLFELTEIMRQKDNKAFAEILNRLHIGIHTKKDLDIIETRRVTQEQSEQLHHLPHCFPTGKRVESYNEYVLKASSQYAFTVTATDIPPHDISASTQEQIQVALNKQKIENTGGLPRQVKIVVNHQYDIISSIAVHDGLINGAECCIKYIQEQENKSNFPVIVLVQFEDNHIGSEQCSKYRYLQKCKSINSDWTPIFAQKGASL